MEAQATDKKVEEQPSQALVVPEAKLAHHRPILNQFGAFRQDFLTRWSAFDELPDALKTKPRNFIEKLELWFKGVLNVYDADKFAETLGKQKVKYLVSSNVTPYYAAAGFIIWQMAKVLPQSQLVKKGYVPNEGKVDWSLLSFTEFTQVPSQVVSLNVVTKRLLGSPARTSSLSRLLWSLSTSLNDILIFRLSCKDGFLEQGNINVINRFLEFCFTWCRAADDLFLAKDLERASKLLMGLKVLLSIAIERGIFCPQREIYVPDDMDVCRIFAAGLLKEADVDPKEKQESLQQIAGLSENQLASFGEDDDTPVTVMELPPKKKGELHYGTLYRVQAFEQRIETAIIELEMTAHQATLSQQWQNLNAAVHNAFDDVGRAFYQLHNFIPETERKQSSEEYPNRDAYYPFFSDSSVVQAFGKNYPSHAAHVFRIEWLIHALFYIAGEMQEKASINWMPTGFQKAFGQEFLIPVGGQQMLSVEKIMQLTDPYINSEFMSQRLLQKLLMKNAAEVKKHAASQLAEGKEQLANNRDKWLKPAIEAYEQTIKVFERFPEWIDRYNESVGIIFNALFLCICSYARCNRTIQRYLPFFGEIGLVVFYSDCVLDALRLFEIDLQNLDVRINEGIACLNDREMIRLCGRLKLIPKISANVKAMTALFDDTYGFQSMQESWQRVRQEVVELQFFIHSLKNERHLLQKLKDVQQDMRQNALSLQHEYLARYEAGILSPACHFQLGERMKGWRQSSFRLQLGGIDAFIRAMMESNKQVASNPSGLDKEQLEVVESKRDVEFNIEIDPSSISSQSSPKSKRDVQVSGSVTPPPEDPTTAQKKKGPSSVSSTPNHNRKAVPHDIGNIRGHSSLTLSFSQIFSPPVPVQDERKLEAKSESRGLSNFDLSTGHNLGRGGDGIAMTMFKTKCSAMGAKDAEFDEALLAIASKYSITADDFVRYRELYHNQEFKTVEKRVLAMGQANNDDDTLDAWRQVVWAPEDFIWRYNDQDKIRHFLFACLVAHDFGETKFLDQLFSDITQTLQADTPQSGAVGAMYQVCKQQIKKHALAELH